MASKKRNFILAFILCLLYASIAFAGTVTYQYDSLNRLIKATYPDGTAIQYTYDAAGNRLSKIATSANQPPIINSFTADPTSGNAPLDVTLTCTAHDPDGSVVSYQWDFDGDGTADQTTTDGSVTYTYSEAGTYQAKVTVVDGEGAETSSNPVTITVINPATGDCNGDGTVSIDEVQKAINCFLSIQNTCCDKSDLNGDGKVTIDEVQKVINAFLGK